MDRKILGLLVNNCCVQVNQTLIRTMDLCEDERAKLSVLMSVASMIIDHAAFVTSSSKTAVLKALEGTHSIYDTDCPEVQERSIRL